MSTPVSQRANALVAVLLMIAIAGTAVVAAVATGLMGKLTRDASSAALLADARQALIAYAATYRDRNAGEVFGYLPCPDTNNDGIAEASCAAADQSVIGRLPWKTLGIAAPHDSASECLWYAVSGRYKNNPKTTALNWDTLGQFNVFDAGGAQLNGSTAHNRAAAFLFAPGGPQSTQARGGGAAGSECQGNNTINAFLDGADPIYAGTVPAAGATSTLTVASPDSIANLTNNDQGLAITSSDLFGRVKARSDFKADIDALLNDHVACLNSTPVASLPAASATNKGIDNVVTDTFCPLYGTQKTKVRDQWKSNLLYTRPVGAITVNGSACSAALFFSGERTTTQSRSTAAEIAAVANYLEGGNATAFPNGPAFTGAAGFSGSAASADVSRCIVGLPAGATQVSFLKDFGNFVTAGVGVSTNASERSVAYAGAAGATGGCFWYPTALPLAGKTLRAYYRFQFGSADSHGATGSGTDRGNGFVFELLRTMNGAVSLAAPTALCGTAADMGALTISTPGAGSTYGLVSLISETDVHQDAANNDSQANHVALMANGNLAHSAGNGNLSSACNGSQAGCTQTPGDRFEETPAPALHNQRLEIATGCNSSCSTCTPASHAAPNNNYARLRLWIDCTDCADVTVNSSVTPNAQRCIQLNADLNSAYFGLTGSMRSGAAIQSATISEFIVRTD